MKAGPSLGSEQLSGFRCYFLRWEKQRNKLGDYFSSYIWGMLMQCTYLTSKEGWDIRYAVVCKRLEGLGFWGKSGLQTQRCESLPVTDSNLGAEKADWQGLEERLEDRGLRQVVREEKSQQVRLGRNGGGGKECKPKSVGCCVAECRRGRILFQERYLRSQEWMRWDREATAGCDNVKAIWNVDRSGLIEESLCSWWS